MFEHLEGIGCFYYGGGPESFALYPLGDGQELCLTLGYENEDSESGGYLMVSGPVLVDGASPYQRVRGTLHLGFMTNKQFAGLVNALKPRKKYGIEARQKQIDEDQEFRYSEPM